MGSALAYHQMKHKAEVVNVVGYHNEREEEDEENRKDYSNKNIDHERTGENIFLKRSSGSYQKDIKEIVKKRTDKPIRKNAVMMVGHTIQFGGDVTKLPEEEQVEILKRGYAFISERYGESNVISATIHRDETNPHLHVDMVPMTEDGRLSARDVVTRAELRNVQADLLEFMQEEYPELGFDRLTEEERAFSNGKSQEDFVALSKIAEKQKQDAELRDNLNRGKVRKLNEREEKLDTREAELNTRESELNTRESEVNTKKKDNNKRVRDINRVTEKQRDRSIKQGETEERQTKKQEELSETQSQLNEKMLSLIEKEESLEVVKQGLLSKDEYLKLKEEDIDKKTENLKRMMENAHIPKIRENLEKITERSPLSDEEREDLILTDEDLDDLLGKDSLQL